MRNRCVCVCDCVYLCASMVSLNPLWCAGLALSFFKRVGSLYNKTGPVFYFEPHVAEAAFNSMLQEQAGLTVFLSETLTSATVVDGRITSITTGSTPLVESDLQYDESVFSATVFIDASYEGDLLAAAGVPYTVGREGNETYGETLAGRLAVPNPYGGHQFEVPLNYTDGNGNLLPMLTGPPGKEGAGDNKVQAFNYRLCMTKNKNNMVRFPKPDDYDPAYWELFRRCESLVFVDVVRFRRSSC